MFHKCISEISDWMNKNKLKINGDKTEFLLAGTPQQHAKLLFDYFSVSGTIIPCVKNIGVIIDEELTINNHITYICNSCYHYLRNVCTVQPYLTTSLKPSCIELSPQKMDYCNSLFIFITKCTKCCCQNCPQYEAV